MGCGCSSAYEQWASMSTQHSMEPHLERKLPPPRAQRSVRGGAVHRVQRRAPRHQLQPLQARQGGEQLQGLLPMLLCGRQARQESRIQE